MKRVLLALILVLAAASAFAFDPARRPDRIGILRSSTDAGDAYVENAVVQALLTELRNRKLDAFDTNLELEELDGDDIPMADYFIEIAGSDADSADFGGIGIGGRHADVELSLVMSRVAAELRVYDGATLELVTSKKLAHSKRAVLPTSLGLGTRSLFAVIALPMVERAQFKSVVSAAARDAAAKVIEAVRGE